MNPVYVLWGTKEGAPEWAEDLIVETEDKEVLEKAKVWAQENGFVKLRVLEWRGEAPNFKKVLR